MVEMNECELASVTGGDLVDTVICVFTTPASEVMSCFESPQTPDLGLFNDANYGVGGGGICRYDMTAVSAY